MNDIEKYEFDRQGFLVLPAMLTPKETGRLAAAVDKLEAEALRRIDQPPRKQALWGANYHHNIARGYHAWGNKE